MNHKVNMATRSYKPMGVVFSSTQGEKLTLGRLSEGRDCCLVCFLRGQVLKWED